MPIQVQLRRGTTTQWSTANPILAAGELGVDTTLTKFKVGNGSTAWNSLGYTTVTFQNAYVGGTTYYPNDIVTYQGSSYINIAQSVGNVPTNTTYWALLVAKGDTGATGATGTTGSTGPAGTAATISIGTVTTGAPGSSVSVTNSGTSSAAVLDFSIPQGATGSAGAAVAVSDEGTQITASATNINFTGAGVTATASTGAVTVNIPGGGGGGSGDVVGPASATDDQIALFNSTTGKLIKADTTTGLLKASSGVIAAAVASTDYAPATTGTSAQLLANNGSGGFSNVTVGSGLTLSAGTLTSSGGGLSWQSVQTTGFTAVAGRAYPCNTTSASFTVTLPASASAGDQLMFTDYAGTFATNGLTLNPNGLKINGSTATSGISGNRQSVALVYVDSVQGWISYADVSSQVLFGVPTSAEVLVVAGGASGGPAYGAGGGAGGYRTNSSFPITPGTSYTLTVGGGGAARTSMGQWGNNGSNSVFSTITSAGGGGGGGASGDNIGGYNGGSGGGGGGWIGGSNPGGLGNKLPGTNTDVPTQGNNGGAGFTGGGNRGAGGGGGAGAVGSPGNTTSGGAGGNGSASSITGVSVTYAGGGGGGNMNAGNPSSGGTGGGGGGRGNDAAGIAGTANLGGGGGGSGGATSGAGGSGVVIIAYPSTFNNISSIGAGLTYTLDTTTRSGYKVYTFTAGTGTISW